MTKALADTRPLHPHQTPRGRAHALSSNPAILGWPGAPHLVTLAPLHLALAAYVNIEGDVWKGMEWGCQRLPQCHLHTHNVQLEESSAPAPSP